MGPIDSMGGVVFRSPRSTFTKSKSYGSANALDEGFIKVLSWNMYVDFILEIYIIIYLALPSFQNSCMMWGDCTDESGFLTEVQHGVSEISCLPIQELIIVSLT